MTNNTNNPDPIEIDDKTKDMANDELTITWKDIKEKKEFIELPGQSTIHYQKGNNLQEEEKAFQSGIGDHDDLFVKKKDHERIEMPFQYAARLRGKKKHETQIYPEINFQYGIHYKGKQFRDDNEQYFNHRVDAYPGKTVEFTVTQEKPLPIKKDWEAKLNFQAMVPPKPYRYAVEWEGIYETTQTQNAADLFTDQYGIFLGPGPKGAWQKSGSVVREIDNRSHFSGIVAKNFFDWDTYEAEFDFKPIRATGLRNDPNAKVVTSDGRLVSVPGADNDVLGFIFKAKNESGKVNDFYIFLWEANDQIVSSWRVKSLNGYNVLTGNFSGSYTHEKAENAYAKYNISLNVGTLLGGSRYYSGMKLSSSQMARFRNFSEKSGWGTKHARVYKVTNGVLREVSLTPKNTPLGWKQDWFKLNYMNSVKIRMNGRNVKIYTQSYVTGNFKDSNYRLIYEFNVDSGFELGSVGLATFSQAVQFYRIKVAKWEPMSGRVPSSGWNETIAAGTTTVSSNATSYVNNSAKQKAKGKPYEVTRVRGIEDPSVSSHGSISVKGLTGPIKVSTINHPDAGKTKNFSVTKKGSATINPDQTNYITGAVVFTSKSFFNNELNAWKRKNPAYKVLSSSIEIVKPEKTDKDWSFNKDRLVLWNSKPEVVVTKKEFTKKVYAYQGWVDVVKFNQDFDGNKWSKYKLDYRIETLNPDFDEIVLIDGWPNGKVRLRTIEWYKGIYPADIKSDGIVTNEKDVFVEIPPMPEHYVHPKTGEVMYHGYEDVHFLLIQIQPKTNQFVWMGFKSKFSKENTKITKAKNVINGRPLVYTDKINDLVQIHCEPNPRYVPWTSGKYIGYGKVNGKRPFFKDNAGKADMVDVPTDVVFIPDNVVELSPPIVEVDDDRVKFELYDGNKKIRFYSDYQDAYIWYTDWYTKWKSDPKTYTANNEEIITINQPIDLDPTEDSTYNPNDTIIEKVEVKSTNPFVDVWTNLGDNINNGLLGKYYKFPLHSVVLHEAFQVTGDYQEKIQEYEIKSYMTKVDIEIQETEPFQILEVQHEGQTVPKNNQNGWSLEGNQVALHGSFIKPGHVTIRYSLGDYSNQFALQKEVGEGVEVYVNGEQISHTDYQIVNQTLYVNKDLLFMHDWVHIQSYKLKEPFDPTKETYLGEIVGSRIDENIWFDFQAGSPFPLNEISALEATPFKVLSVSKKTTADFEYNLDMELIYPESTNIDISNFTGEWVQWDQDPIVKYNGSGQPYDGPGDWHGPPEPGFPEVTNLRNQSYHSGWYNPNHAELTDYEFSFKVQARQGDDDMYGAIFKFDPVTQNFYSFEWDAYHSIGSGGTGVKGMAIYKNICLNPNDAGKAILKYNRKQLAHLDISWTANAAEIHEIKIRTVGNEIKVWTDNILRFDIKDNDNPFIKGAWGPVTQSQPYTFFWDFWLSVYKRITYQEEPTFRKTMIHSIQKPYIEEDPMFEINIHPKTVGEEMREVLEQYLAEHPEVERSQIRIEYFIRNDFSDYNVYFKENQNKLTITTLGEAQIYATIEGLEPPQSPPINIELPNVEEPDIDPIDVPTENNPNDGFAINWKGFIYAPISGYYYFRVRVNDGFRLWINNAKIIDIWNVSEGQTKIGSIYLKGNQWHSIEANYFENQGNAYVFLEWKQPNMDFSKIPNEYLSSYLNYIIHAKVKHDTPLPWHPLVHNGYYYHGKDEHYLYSQKIYKKVESIEGTGVILKPRPQQGSPVIIRKSDGTVLRKVAFYDKDWNLTLENTETFNGNGYSKYYLRYADIDPNTVKIKINNEHITDFIFNPNESSIQFMKSYGFQDTIEVKYILENSYYIDYNHQVDLDTALVVFYKPEKLKNIEIIYEGSYNSPFYQCVEVTINPLLTHMNKGFLYISEKGNMDVKQVHLKVSESYVKENSNEKILLTGIVLDQYENPVSNKKAVFYRNGAKIFEGYTNEAGEIYYLDEPKSSSQNTSVYSIKVDSLTDERIVHHYQTHVEDRIYLELKTENPYMISGSSKQIGIYAALRDKNFDVIKGKNITFVYQNTKGETKEITKTTDQKGQAVIYLSGENEKRGTIYITAYTFNEKNEKVQNDVYVDVIGE